MLVLPRPPGFALLRQDMSLLAWLRGLWIFAVLWYELVIYRYTLFVCRWPDQALSPSSVLPTHVLVITDPQVRHALSRKQTRFFAQLSDWSYHAGLRRGWRYASQLRPDVVVFLGDVMASGRKIKDDVEYVENYVKFRRIFSIDKSIPVYHAPGNEDVGLNLKEMDAVHAQHRYITHFGPLNSQASVANHSLIFINAPGLVEEDYQRARHVGSKVYADFEAPAGGTVDFVRSFARHNQDGPHEPAILFTHIPLARPESASCGAFREHGTIRRGAGPGYQNMFGKLTTQFLLDTVKPVLVLSGDDRDYCEYTHVLSSEHQNAETSMREVTVKSFAPNKNIRNPGFHMLSLIPPQHVHTNDTSATTYADSPCFLPSQDLVYSTIYLPATILTILILIVHRLRRHRGRPHQSPLPSYQFESDRTLASSGIARRSAGPTLRGEDSRKGLSLQRKRQQSFRRSGLTLTTVQPSFSSLAVARIQGALKRVTGLGGSPAKDAPIPVHDSARHVQAWRVACRLFERVALDFVAVAWPAALLWSAVMWYTLR